jgi:hypothetical protein
VSVRSKTNIAALALVQVREGQGKGEEGKEGQGTDNNGAGGAEYNDR